MIEVGRHLLASLLYQSVHPPGRLIPNGDQFSINPSGTTLRISQVHPAHHGVYECKAENIAGSRTASAKLEVKARGQGLHLCHYL